MLRIAIMLLVIAGSMRAGSSPAAPGEIEIEMEILNESESAFILGDSRISVEIRDQRAAQQERHVARMDRLFC